MSYLVKFQKLAFIFGCAFSGSRKLQCIFSLFFQMMNLNIVPFFPGDNSTFNVSEADEYAGVSEHRPQARLKFGDGIRTPLL